MADKEPTPAYSDETGTSYDSWDELVEAEANGYAATAVLTNGKRTWTWSLGPYATKREANNAGVRLRAKIKKEAPPSVRLVVISVRPLWKDNRG